VDLLVHGLGARNIARARIHGNDCAKYVVTQNLTLNSSMQQCSVCIAKQRDNTPTFYQNNKETKIVCCVFIEKTRPILLKKWAKQ
jgi:hypothetical protein